MQTHRAVRIALTCAGLGAPVSAQDRPPIIDMHMHAHEPGAWLLPPGVPTICRPQPCTGEGSATASSAESLRRTLAEMDRHNVVLGFLSGELETVREWLAAAPGRFIPSPFILRPGHPSAQQLRREYEAGRLKGMGEIAVQLHGFAPDDPEVEPYFALAAELDLPLLIHVEGIGPQVPGFRSAAGNPLRLEPVLAKYPDLRVYVENAGYPFLEEMVALMYQYPQLHGDLSTITWVIPRAEFHRYMQGFITAGLTGRLMFGSDQMRWPETIGRAIDAIESVTFLSPAQKRAIFHDNAARFLRLERRADGYGQAARPGRASEEDRRGPGPR